MVHLIAEVLRAPMCSQAFRGFARAQLFRTMCSFGRGYELRFSSWPYQLWRLAGPQWTEDERREAVGQLLAVKREELGIHSFSIKCLYKTSSALMSYECARRVEADMAAHPYGIDTIERMNA